MEFADYEVLAAVRKVRIHWALRPTAVGQPARTAACQHGGRAKVPIHAAPNLSS